MPGRKKSAGKTRPSRPARGSPSGAAASAPPDAQAPAYARPSALIETRVVYCGDCLDQLRKLPDASIDLIYIDPPLNSNRNYEVFWGETKEKRAFDDRHGNRQQRAGSDCRYHAENRWRP
jgi:hypothetical protein